MMINQPDSRILIPRRSLILGPAILIPRRARPQVSLPLLGVGGGGACTPSPRTPVNQTTSTSGGATTYNITIPAAANGNSLVVIAANAGTIVRTISSISATNTSGWAGLAPIEASSNTGTRIGIEIWAGQVSGGSSGTTLAVTFNSAVGTSAGFNVTEWIKLTGTPADGAGTGTNSGPNNTLTTTSIGAAYSMAVANDLLICGCAATNTFSGDPGGSYSLLTSITMAALAGGLHSAYINPASSGTAPTATWNFAASRVAATMIGLKATCP